MIDWYWTALNTGHCDLTPLMSFAVYVPMAVLIVMIMAWLSKIFR